MWQDFSILRKEYLDRVDTHSEAYRIKTVNTFLYETLRLSNTNPITKQEFSDIITGKEKPKTDMTRKASDLYKAWLFVQEQAQAHTALTLELTREIASRVMKHTGKLETTTIGRYDSSLGDFRLGEDYLSAYPIADFSNIPDLLDGLCKTIREKIDKIRGVQTVRLAADFMYDFAHIKPFGTGNTEVGLLIMNYIQAYHDEPMILIFAEDRPRYLNALKREITETHPETFENFIIGQQIKFYKRGNRQQKADPHNDMP